MTGDNVQLGQRILIALGDRPAALELVRTVADQIRSPDGVEVTLMHYMMPMYWEHGGSVRPRAVRDRELEERDVKADELTEEARTKARFRQAQAILEAAGVPGANIHTELAWKELDKNHAVLDELHSGAYSDVVVGEGDADFLTSLFAPPLADVLKRHADGTTVWAVPLAQIQQRHSA